MWAKCCGWIGVRLALAAIVALLSPAVGSYAFAGNDGGVGAVPPIVVDWQGPSSLPPRFRNHCRYDPSGGIYCANHCGLDAQFYYCSRESFGCCRPGRGYCGWDGVLRCAP